jgi:hypothetical protein
LTVTASPLVLAYLAGEMGVLTLVASALAAGVILYRLRQPPVATQPIARAREANL